jgi:hypothetical protein
MNAEPPLEIEKLIEPREKPVRDAAQVIIFQYRRVSLANDG